MEHWGIDRTIEEALLDGWAHGELTRAFESAHATMMEVCCAVLKAFPSGYEPASWAAIATPLHNGVKEIAALYRWRLSDESAWDVLGEVLTTPGDFFLRQVAPLTPREQLLSDTGWRSDIEVYWDCFQACAVVYVALAGVALKCEGRGRYADALGDTLMYWYIQVRMKVRWPMGVRTQMC